MILVESAVNGGHPLKRIDSTASLHVHAHRVLNIELTLKTWAFFKNIEVRVTSGPLYLSRSSPVFLLSLVAEYDKKSISHARIPCTPPGVRCKISAAISQSLFLRSMSLSVPKRSSPLPSHITSRRIYDTVEVRYFFRYPCLINFRHS